MSGIAGILSLDGKSIHRRQFEAIGKSLLHRGSVTADWSTSNSIGLTQILTREGPEYAHESLPFSNKETNSTIVGDARLDNREDLMRILIGSSRPSLALPTKKSF